MYKPLKKGGSSQIDSWTDHNSRYLISLKSHQSKLTLIILLSQQSHQSQPSQQSQQFQQKTKLFTKWNENT